MKKWQRMSLSLGLASSLLVPGLASATTKPVDLEAMKEKAKQDLAKKLKLSESEQTKLAYQKQQEQQEVLSDNTIVVKYAKKLPASIHLKAGVIVDRSIPSLGYDIVKLSKGQKMADVVSYYSKQQGVLSATPSVTYKTFALNDPKQSKMYHLSLLNIDKALSLAGDNKVTVAVIDTGMDLKHPELKSQVLPPYNVLNPANLSYTDVHGTHVAGLIAGAKGNGVGGYGVNPNAKILPIDVFNGMWGTSDYAIAEGILYAVSKNVDVINMSLGGSMPSPILEEAVKKAIDAGITVVAAAGNNYGESVSYPAAYEGVIAVSATNDKKELAEFSSYGAFVDIAAPGEAVYSSVFDFLKGSSFAELSGTSMATPIVAGVASLLKSKYPDLKPYEVEAILKMTADDLGDKGYDVKYGAGLVDPVKALQFDLKNLPKVVEAADKTKAVELTEEKGEWTKSFTQPGDMHWYQVKLEKGQGVQALLDGAKAYNYKLMFEFLPEGKTEASVKRDINDVNNGKQEGSFFQATENGTLYIAVKDVYGQYDESGASHYTLKLQKETEMKIDNVTAQEPVVISGLPFNSEDSSTLTFAVDAEAKEGDKDYFRFTVEEPTMVKFELSAVPGINSSISAYFEEEFLNWPPKDLPPDVYAEVPTIQYANNNGVSEGETMSFEAMPGMNYLIEVSSEPRRDYFYEFIFGIPQTEKAVPNSNTPYTLKGSKLDLGQDEDGFPERDQGPEEKFKEGEMTEAEYKEKKVSDFRAAMEQMAEQPKYRYFQDEKMLATIREKALPFELGGKIEGKINFSGDEDYYKFTATGDEIFQFELGKTKELFPWVQIMEYDEENNDLLPIADIWTDYYYYLFGGGGEQNLTRTLALKEGKEYYIRFMNNRYQASEESYQFTSKKLMDVPTDNDIDENKDLRAKVLQPGDKDQNHLIYATDTDFYYYKNHGEENHLSLTVNPQSFTDEEKKNLPKELQGALIPFLTIVEDTNGNMVIDEEEFGKANGFYPDYYATVFNVNSSFKAKKDVGYFFVLNGYGYNGLSIEPYEIALHNWNTNDEDKDSVVKNNVPSKPAALKSTKTGYTAEGYFNPGIDFGDKDYYSLKVDKYSKLQVNLELPAGLDGSITIFDSKGKKVGRYDHYGAGDAEVANVTLPKGQYYILVEEALGRTSLEAYKLTVTK
ncbi:S8 family peptidase [Neobacillus sp. D3-1R]|uniref:S8 family peptidase n=1 Tax=Neobacillus sp. D3-1R TaxID=3445778 RepID=UPI003F9F66CB